mmetsp:Transcript_63/g.166  ORF Transcript_63/g.166 Transcript_63/m.166 type:complete len:103 (-) Transcript_63:752-1060(-)
MQSSQMSRRCTIVCSQLQAHWLLRCPSIVVLGTSLLVVIEVGQEVCLLVSNSCALDMPIIVAPQTACDARAHWSIPASNQNERDYRTTCATHRHRTHMFVYH